MVADSKVVGYNSSMSNTNKATCLCGANDHPYSIAHRAAHDAAQKARCDAQSQLNREAYARRKAAPDSLADEIHNFFVHLNEDEY